MAGDIPGACADGETGRKMDPKNRGAFELMMYSCGRGPRVSGEAKAEKVSRLVAMKDQSIPHDAQEWARREDQNPTKAGALIVQIVRQRKAGDLGKAMRLAELAVEADASDPMARVQRGRLKSDFKDYNGAVIDLSHAIALGWKDDVLFKLRGEALLRAGRAEAALDDAEMAVAYAPKDASAYFLRAMAKLELSRPKEDVMADLEVAAKLDSERFSGFLQQTRDAFAKAKAEAGAEAGGADKAGGKTAAEVPGARAATPWHDSKAMVALIAAAGAAAVLVLAIWGWSRGRAPVVASSAQAVGEAVQERLIGKRYKMGRLIGEGGMGKVFEGQDKHVGRKVAIKVPQENLQADPQTLDRIDKEGKLHVALSHDNIVSILDIVREDSRIYLVFELVRGQTLAELLSMTPGGRLAPDAAWRIIEPVCSALDFAHSKRVVHRDLKPSNIMLVQGGGAVKVMDFGVARVAKDSLMKTTGTVAGTPVYMAPEQMAGKTCGESDFYSLGICAYEMVSGRLPFEPAAHLELKRKGEFQPVTAVAAVPAGLDGFFKKALDPNPGKRFHSGAEFAAEFSRACSLIRS